jgi:PEP-CTERM motif
VSVEKIQILLAKKERRNEMKRGMLMSILLFGLVSIAKADTVVSVVLEPTQFTGLSGFINGHLVEGNETVGVSFNWDTTKETLSNFVLTAAGPWGTGLSNIPADVAFDPSGSIFLMNFNGPGVQFQLDYLNHAPDGFPHLSSAPGTYFTDLGFFCDQCTPAKSDFEIGTATVTATPEPGTLTLLGVGLLGLLARKRRKPAQLSQLGAAAVNSRRANRESLV